MTGALLYRWPEAAKFGRVVPKTKFYEHATVSATVREKFVAEVQRITWAYKLAETTIHLRGNAAVPEIQVFVIDAKDDDVSDAVLTAIDKAVQFPIIFEVNRGAGERPAHGWSPPTSSSAARSARSAPTSRPTGSPLMRRESPLPAGTRPASPLRRTPAPILPIAARPVKTLSETTARIDQAREARTRDRSAGAEASDRTAAQPQGRAAPTASKTEPQRSTALTDPATPKTSNALERETPWTS